MSETRIEGIVKDGQIVLEKDYKLPESTRVYIVVPGKETNDLRIMSPRLADPKRIAEFEYEVVDVSNDEI